MERARVRGGGRGRGGEGEEGGGRRRGGGEGEERRGEGRGRIEREGEGSGGRKGGEGGEGEGRRGGREGVGRRGKGVEGKGLSVVDTSRSVKLLCDLHLFVHRSGVCPPVISGPSLTSDHCPAPQPDNAGQLVCVCVWGGGMWYVCLSFCYMYITVDQDIAFYGTNVHAL